MITVTFDIPQSVAVYNWCVEQFGKPTLWSDNGGWRHAVGTVFFCDEKDATMFLLRWGGEVAHQSAASQFVAIVYG